MNKYLLFALLVGVLLNSEGCRRRRLSRSAPPRSIPADTVVATRPTPPADTAKAPVLTRPGIDEARAIVAEIDFKYLVAKSKVSFKSKDQDISNANVNLRVRKDSVIWFAVTGLGLEVARGMITRDSIHILDKIHKEYAAYDFPTLSRQFNFNLTFDLLQALIVGNLPLPQKPAQKVKRDRDYLLLRQTEGKVLVENYIGEEDRKLKKLMVVEQPTRNTLRLDYENFAALNNFLFPFTSLITLDYQSKTDGQYYQSLLRVQHNKVELVDKNPGFPFTIPAKYERRP
ncbi:DUF4292 domain-containing protein [Fibrisoma montanum]|uniref:DUF4292 domain-containing protein n=1 Tax=Fibrisoma montanum TaxID=2305895 RepID=A0A418MJ30_9BACT|nr:DUF4292 domain-containing protein [Fibrisoma montanum]RIV27331.1 DUF4292 domain-containing protein [Fibrisoma montanum]